MPLLTQSIANDTAEGDCVLVPIAAVELGQLDISTCVWCILDKIVT